MAQDDDETSQNESEEQGGEDEADSFMQVIQAKRNIDDDNAQAAEMARMEDQADNIMGEDNDETSASDSDERGSGDQADSFIQVKRNIDDDNAQAAEMARMEDQAAQADNIMGGDDDDDETPQNESKEQGSTDEADSF